MNQANAFGAFKQHKKVEKESSKKDGSDTEEENLDEMSMSSFSTQKTGP